MAVKVTCPVCGQPGNPTEKYGLCDKHRAELTDLDTRDRTSEAEVDRHLSLLRDIGNYPFEIKR